MIRFKHKGNFKNTERFLTQSQMLNFSKVLSQYGREGVAALETATPVDSGETASSWGFETNIKPSYSKITWTNQNVEGGVPVAILIQYGHATRNGGYVQGRDFINPAMRPIFDGIADALWREVVRL
jgi:hypothetical protein